jgi:hypothetical protein
MWRVRFELEVRDATGQRTNTRAPVIESYTLIESGFPNQGQAEVWYAVGARQRYGPAFWNRVKGVKVEEATR